jgi:enamidase
MIKCRYAPALLLMALLASAADGQEPTLVIENGRVIVGSGTVLERATVVIAGERILSVTEDQVDAPAARRIDAAGLTVLPGLIDAHVHITIGPEVADSASLAAFLEQSTTRILRDFLGHGVTTIRSTGDYWPWIGQVRDRIRTGDMPGPRLLAAGPVVTIRDAHPATTVCQGAGFCRSALVAEVENAEDARTVVQRLAAEGVDFVKMVSDSVLVPVQIPDDVMAAIIAQGHRHGLEVVGHVAEAEFMRKAAEMGLDGFVHATFRPLPVERARELASVLVQHGTPVTTTLSAELVYSGEPVQQVFELMSGLRQSVEGAAQALATMAEEGVQLVVGTDWCSCAPLGDGPLHPAIRAGAVTITEMEMLGWGGLANEAVLAAATINAARALGLSSELGTLEVGKVADLILVEGNPLDDIAALRNVRTVVQGGAVVVEN